MRKIIIKLIKCSKHRERVWKEEISVNNSGKNKQTKTQGMRERQSSAREDVFMRWISEGLEERGSKMPLK